MKIAAPEIFQIPTSEFQSAFKPGTSEFEMAATAHYTVITAPITSGTGNRANTGTASAILAQSNQRRHDHHFTSIGEYAGQRHSAKQI